MSNRVSTALPHLRALNILSQLPPGDQPALNHLCALACCLTGADAAGVLILDEAGSGHVLGQDGLAWTLCPLTAEQIGQQAPLGADHPMRSGQVDALALVALYPLRIEGALIGGLLAAQRQTPGQEAPAGWPVAASAKLKHLAYVAADQIAAELAMARLARMAQAAFGRSEGPA